jgi:predicted anti-sigma-YlaC factor YlaD
VDGTLLGTFFSAASGAVLAAVVCNATRTCSNHTGGIAATVGISAGVGAGIGALTDAAVMKPESVYRASKQTSRLHIAPYLAGRSKAVQLSVRF